MPSVLTSRLNDTINGGFLAAELNGVINPFLAVTFELNSGLVFDFHGIVAELSTNQTPPGVLDFLVFGDEQLSVLPEDNFIALRQRGIQTNSFYFARATVDFSEKHYSVRDLFPFPNPRYNPGQYTFFVGVPGVIAADLNITLTVYGRVRSVGESKFPYDFR